MDNLSSLNRPLYKDISNNRDNSIKIYSSNNKNIEISSRKYLYKDREKNQLSKEAITDFQDLYEAKFGYRPNPEEAEVELLKLMRIVLLTQPEMHKFKKLKTINVKQNKL